MTLFIIGNKFSQKFHLLLSEKDTKLYEEKIKINGGDISVFATDSVTTLSQKLLDIPGKHKVYGVQYIDDCIQKQNILDISDYALNKELSQGCSMCTLLYGFNKCKCVDLL